jgi:hypothetical protein
MMLDKTATQGASDLFYTSIRLHDTVVMIAPAPSVGA